MMHAEDKFKESFKVGTEADLIGDKADVKAQKSIRG